MIKSLVKHGNSSALVIEKPILSLLGATAESEFEVVTDGKSLILTPVQNAVRHERFRKAMAKTGKHYSKTFEELAH
ncbi:MAG: AbrB/MazE/SpoVT family DNA-binding domain-containing protein [Lentisphaeria bacterium]|nr:AbrB/MazE/SpoVT family DNA-binding domain-containing protein [Lentisphaeria bacterium]